MGVKISDLPSATHLSGFELQPFVQCGQTRQTAVSSVFSSITAQSDDRYFCSTTIAGNKQGVITLGGAGGATIGIGLSTGDSVGFASITTAGLTLTGGNLTAGKSALSANNASIVTNLTASSIQGTSLLSAGTGGITTSGNLSSGRDLRALGKLTVGKSQSNSSIAGCPATIAGGCAHSIANFGFIGGGCANSTQPFGVSVGGECNIGCSSYGFIGGGCKNSVSGNCAAVVGGRENDGQAHLSFIGGGLDNCANGTCSSILGGTDNTITGEIGSIAGGQCNTIACGTVAVVAGGCKNTVCSNAGFIGGGSDNTIKTAHTCSAIVGGTDMRTVSANMLHAKTLFLVASALPTSDPGVAGVVYLSGGGAAGHTLMISK